MTDHSDTTRPLPNVTSTPPPLRTTPPPKMGRHSEMGRHPEMASYVAPPPPPPPPQPRKRQSQPQRAFPPTWAILLIMFGGVIVIGVIVAGLLSLQTAVPEGGAESLTVAKLTTFNTPPTVPAGVSVVQENNIPLMTVLPNRLTVARTDYSVVPVAPEQGRWPMPTNTQNVAVWIYGTVVNYVIGLPYTPTNESLLAELTGVDQITLTLDNGTTLAFGTPQAQRIAADDLSPMDQSQPGITLVLLGSTTADRLMVRARYLPEQTVTSAHKQHVDNLTVEVLKSGIVGANSGYQQFIVEYRVTNAGQAPLNAQFFDLILEDSQGQRYQVNPDVTNLGEYGALQTEIAVGVSMQGSAGYMLPDTLVAPITWIFRADPTSGNTARYPLAYQPPLPQPAQPEVTLTSAFIDGARGVIVINGEIRNLGESPLSVTLNEIELTSSSGASSLQASTPLLPWNVDGGQSQQFEIQFSRPAGATSVLLDILGFTFQLQ
ncbi:MAG: hypothetical protein JXA33_07645 [Anaerolineae bacterium]|nr:hypothetical protein [Anaerolineae bacterium]